MHALIAGFAILNLLTFFLFGLDKRRAVREKWRVSEKTLLLFCALFGAAGGWVGMKLFRHKTRKPRFRFGVPLLLILQMLLIALGFHFGQPML